jgi:hypothetical protein
MGGLYEPLSAGTFLPGRGLAAAAAVGVAVGVGSAILARNSQKALHKEGA